MSEKKPQKKDEKPAKKDPKAKKDPTVDEEGLSEEELENVSGGTAFTAQGGPIIIGGKTRLLV